MEANNVHEEDAGSDEVGSHRCAGLEEPHAARASQSLEDMERV